MRPGAQRCPLFSFPKSHGGRRSVKGGLCPPRPTAAPASAATKNAFSIYPCLINRINHRRPPVPSWGFSGHIDFFLLPPSLFLDVFYFIFFPPDPCKELLMSSSDIPHQLTRGFCKHPRRCLPPDAASMLHSLPLAELCPEVGTEMGCVLQDAPSPTLHKTAPNPRLKRSHPSLLAATNLHRLLRGSLSFGFYHRASPPAPACLGSLLHLLLPGFGSWFPRGWTARSSWIPSNLGSLRILRFCLPHSGRTSLFCFILCVWWDLLLVPPVE